MSYKKTIVIADEKIINKIYFIRGKKVMLDKDLAKMYGVETKVLNQAVTRNRERFPPDFMFQLTREEYDFLRSQFVTLERGRGKYPKYLPCVFTEQGVAMLSGVLNSKRAIAVNIQIMRIFTRMREMIMMHKNILLKLEQLERKILRHDNRFKKQREEIQVIFETLKQLLTPSRSSRRRIGYRLKGDGDE